VPTVVDPGKELVTSVANDSDSQDRHLCGTVLSAFRHASARLQLTQAYFVPNLDLLNAMTQVAERGVDV
jgi:cardiolipin synthase